LKNISILAFGVVAAMFASAAYAGALDDIKKRGELICGVTTGSNPISYNGYFMFI
jgi:ABC-type amino acid transport substrate-binding protein|tara:strand:+ start:211 stop:375 length:165 start_codon:yes stop_codon:yes gene_type:complete